MQASEQKDKRRQPGKVLFNTVSLVLSALMLSLPIVISPGPIRVVRDDVAIVEEKEVVVDADRFREIEDMHARMVGEEDEEQEGQEEAPFPMSPVQVDDNPKKKSLWRWIF